MGIIPFITDTSNDRFLHVSGLYLTFLIDRSIDRLIDMRSFLADDSDDLLVLVLLVSLTQDENLFTIYYTILPIRS